MSSAKQTPGSPIVRARGAVRRGINRAMDRAGLELVPKQPDGWFEPEFLEDHARYAPYTMTSRDRMYALWQAARHVAVAGVDGDVVECGVWRGGSTMLAAQALARAGDERTLWLYDTFEGMPAPGPEDSGSSYGEDPSAQWEALQAGDHNEWAYAPVDEVRAGLRRTGLPEERFRLVKGKVQDTIPGTAPERIALLRLDTDWYESTRHELETLFPRLQSGGVLIIDDYGHFDGARRAVDEYFAASDVRVLLNRIDDTGRIAVKP